MNIEDRVRVVSKGGVFLSYVSHKQATRMIFDGRARVRDANRKRLRCIMAVHGRVEAKLPGQRPLTYRERLGDTRSVIVLLRVTKDGRFVPWDQGLTFKEVRAGQIISQDTRERRLAAA